MLITIYFFRNGSVDLGVAISIMTGVNDNRKRDTNSLLPATSVLPDTIKETDDGDNDTSVSRASEQQIPR